MLRQFIAEGRLAPQAIVTHHLPLEEAPRGYELFDRHLEDCRKVVLTPGGPQPTA